MVKNKQTRSHKLQETKAYSFLATSTQDVDSAVISAQEHQRMAFLWCYCQTTVMTQSTFHGDSAPVNFWAQNQPHQPRIVAMRQVLFGLLKAACDTLQREERARTMYWRPRERMGGKKRILYSTLSASPSWALSPLAPKNVWITPRQMNIAIINKYTIRNLGETGHTLYRKHPSPWVRCLGAYSCCSHVPS